jgi:hypothetical protein
MSKVHLARSGFITKAALPSVTRQRGTTTGSSNLMLFGAGKTTVANNNTFIDSSTNAFTVSRFGSAVHSGHNQFSTVSDGSGYFDKVDSYLTIPDNTNLNMGTSDFTLESWIYITSVPTGSFYPNNTNPYEGAYILNKDGKNSVSFPQYSLFITPSMTVGVTLSAVPQTTSPGVTIYSSSTLSLNTWYHVAFTRVGTNGTLWVNGVSNATTTSIPSNLTNGARELYIAYEDRGASIQVQNLFQGYISNLRIVKGTAVYTGTFTPSTSALTAITNTQLLLLTDNYSVVNSTPTVLPITIFGNTTISTTQYPTGMTRSIYFDGNGDYLTTPANSAYAFGTGDFTVEFWVYSNSWSTAPTVIDTRDSGVSNNGYADYFSTGGNFNLYLGSATVFTSSSAISTSTWTHIAVSRAGTSLRVFINGVQNGSTLTNSINFSDTSLLVSVNRGTVPGTINSEFFNGYLSNVRIVKGTAVYTANFTVPSLPLSINISVPNYVTNAIYGVNQLA